MVKLDPEAAEMVKHMPSAPPSGPPDVNGLRGMIRAMSIANAGPSVELASVENLAAGQSGSPVPVRIYRPHGMSDGPSAALLYVHGGGWVAGDLDCFDGVCGQIADRAKCVVVSVDYRLAPEHPFPAATEDMAAVLRWVVNEGQNLNLDTARLAVGGDSAGGNLAIVMAAMARDEKIPLRAQILLYPATDLRQSSWTFAARVDNVDTPPISPGMLKWMMHSYLQGQSADDWRVSPLAMPDFADLAPALIIGGTADPLYDDGRLYGERLAAAGVEVMHRNIPGMIHGFFNTYKLTATEEAHQTISLFLQERLKTGLSA